MLVVKSSPADPADLADGGILTCEYDYKETVSFLNKDDTIVHVRSDSEAASYGSSDPPVASPKPDWGTPREGSPMQGITES